MSASLCIKITSASVEEIQELTFFESGSWTPDDEKQLLFKMQEILAAMRPLIAGASVTLDLTVKDVSSAIFIIKKRTATELRAGNEKLSVRELEVLSLIMQGYTNNEIAEKLFISYETVKSHRKNILEKTGAKNTAALINYYHQTFFEK